MRQRKRPDLRGPLALLLALALSLGLAAPALAADATASSIRLARTEGAVSATNSAGRGVSLVKDLRLFSGYHVRTGVRSYAWMNLDSARLLKEDASSDAEVRQNGKKLEVLVRSGNVFFNVAKPLGGDEVLSIRTSTTLTGVRGTCGWVEVIDRWNTEVCILEGKVECVVADPVSGESELATISAGETATFTVHPEGSPAPNEVEIAKSRCDVEDVPGYVLVELAEDEPLCEDIRDASGLDILGELSRNGDPAAEAQRRLEEEEAAAARQLAAIAAREQAQASNVESAPNDSGAPNTPAAPGGLTTAGDWSWRYEEGAKTLYIEGSGAMDDFASYQDAPWDGARYEIESVVIGEGVTGVGRYAFRSCSGLTSVTIPSSVTRIGEWAFQYCLALTDVAIPSGVTEIGEGAFQSCAKLARIAIPDSVTSIGPYAFQSSGLTRAAIPDSVAYIGPGAFSLCQSLTSVTLSRGLGSIESSTFYNCIRLSSVTIPSGVRTIEAEAFDGCGGLSMIAIPDSVTAIGRYAFRGCDHLTSIDYGGSEAQWHAVNIDSSNFLDRINVHYAPVGPW